MIRKTLAVSAIFGSLLLFGCVKTTDDVKIIRQKYHYDVTIHEQINGSEQSQDALGFYQLSNPNHFLLVASRGVYSMNAMGFRVMGIVKDSAVKWAKSYQLAANHTTQFVNCATIDRDQNVWLSGYYGSFSSGAGVFLVKLDATGNIALSKSIRTNTSALTTIAVKALSNGDIALLTRNNDGYTVSRFSSDGSLAWSKFLQLSPELIPDQPLR